MHRRVIINISHFYDLLCLQNRRKKISVSEYAKVSAIFRIGGIGIGRSFGIATPLILIYYY